MKHQINILKTLPSKYASILLGIDVNERENRVLLLLVRRSPRLARRHSGRIRHPLRHSKCAERHGEQRTRTIDAISSHHVYPVENTAQAGTVAADFDMCTPFVWRWTLARQTHASLTRSSNSAGPRDVDRPCDMIMPCPVQLSHVHACIGSGQNACVASPVSLVAPAGPPPGRHRSELLTRHDLGPLQANRMHCWYRACATGAEALRTAADATFAGNGAMTTCDGKNDSR